MSAETFPMILVTLTGQPKSTWSFPLDVPVARQLAAAFTKAGAFNPSEGFNPGSRRHSTVRSRTAASSCI